MTATTRETPDEYSAAHRSLEISAIVTFLLTSVIAIARLVDSGRPLLAAGAALVGYVLADLLSGVAHWAFDTWGSRETPILGSSFIRPFREHHDDSQSITRHDFVETNGNNCVAALPLLIAACVIPRSTGLGYFVAAMLTATSFGLVATNQIHKWAHEEDPGAVVRLLQRLHLILPAEHHRVHHRSPYETHYCITTGWLNYPLQVTGIFARLERLITRLTGVAPRTEQGSASLGSESLGSESLGSNRL